MNPATISALITGITGLVSAITALIHSMQTRKQVATQQTADGTPTPGRT